MFIIYFKLHYLPNLLKLILYLWLMMCLKNWELSDLKYIVV